jgi:UDP-N-acetylglucosamine diphosphorylase / glucose-1-phosphate thymidylyltransferase / UDP-N-acetylgalactosamine diphosphorylase / glucosamine-1-phosphate N-acetyltransferase / galactosamine-1-phosphate N-acetyltransferase
LSIVTRVIVFEDDKTSNLSPITTGRPAYGVTCASFRLIDWLRRLELPLAGSVRPHLESLQRLDYQIDDADTLWEGEEPLLAVNARLVPSPQNYAVLQRLAQESRPSALWQGEALAAAYFHAPPPMATSDQIDGPQSSPTQSSASQAAAANSGTSLAPSAATAPVAAGTSPPGASPPGASPPGAGRGGGSGSAASVLAHVPAPFTSSLVAPVRPGEQSAAARRAHSLAVAAAALEVGEAELPLFDWPHQVVAWHMRLLNEHLEVRLRDGGWRQVRDGLFVGEGVSIGEHAVIDTSSGPILLDRNVKVGPFCYLSGPVYAGPGSRILEHAALKDGVSLGHTVKIGGEVEASVVEPYSNKQHHGFLGHSYLGSWINLGAGTCNSDLKNTYGLINVQYGDLRVQTGMQFMGCVMGDYTKTAINTGIFTGKVIGVCSMLYGFVTSNVPSFVNYARLFGQMAELPAEVMVASQQRVFARRNVEQRDVDRQLILDMHRLTAREREQDNQLAAL